MEKGHIKSIDLAGELEPRGGRAIMRNYFSSYLLAAAGQMVRSAAAIEDQHDIEGPPRFDLEQRGHILGAILCGVGFFEAMVNELFQDALDRHAPEGSGVASLSMSTRDRMAEYWRATKGRDRALDKYQTLLRFAGEAQLDEGAQPYQEARLTVQLRNAIAHYRPEDLSADEPEKMEKSLKVVKFPDNQMLTGSGNPWWPDHCLGVGCARWALESVVAVADHVTDAVGVKTNYGVHRASGWLGSVPGPPVSKTPSL